MAILDGKVALVTGASRGIGRGVALAMAREGARVAITARTLEPDDAPALAGTDRRVPAVWQRPGRRSWMRGHKSWPCRQIWGIRQAWKDLLQGP